MRLIAVIVSLLLPYPAQAQDAQLRLLPEYMPCDVEGERYACYTADQQMALNILEARALSWQRQASLRLTTLDILESTNSELLTLVAAHVDMQKQREAHVKELTKRLMKEVELKNRYRARARDRWKWPLIVSGSITALAGGALLGLSLAH